MFPCVLVFRCPACPNRIIVRPRLIGQFESEREGCFVLCARCHTAVDFTDRPKVARLTPAERVQLEAATTRDLRRRNAHTYLGQHPFCRTLPTTRR